MHKEHTPETEINFVFYVMVSLHNSRFILCIRIIIILYTYLLCHGLDLLHLCNNYDFSFVYLYCFFVFMFFCLFVCLLV